MHATFMQLHASAAHMLEPSFLPVVVRFCAPFGVVASVAKRLDIADSIVATAMKRNDVIFDHHCFLGVAFSASAAMEPDQRIPLL